MQLRNVELLRTGGCLLPTWERRCDKSEPDLSPGELSDPRSRALAVVIPAGTAHVAAGRMGLKWQRLEVQSLPRTAAEGLCSTSLPTFPGRSHVHLHCHLGGSLSQPETSQPTTVEFAKVPVHLWMLLA